MKYKPGKELLVPDTLSRAPVEDDTVPIPGVVNNLAFTPISKDTLRDIRRATDEDNSLNVLKDTIMKGWPTQKCDVPQCIVPYYGYRDELTVQDGIVIRGDRIVIPMSMRKEMKEKTHAGHSGINSCLRRARELIFWPGKCQVTSGNL